MTTVTTTFPAISSHLNDFSRLKNSPFSPSNFTPINFTPKLNPRLRISHITPRGYCLPLQCCSTDTGNTGISPEKESSIDIKLPRRSLLVQFTCKSCGERTKRLINRVAYERGTVFVQCSGCLQHHKLVDNLGLVVEYDFRNETAEE